MLPNSCIMRIRMAVMVRVMIAQKQDLSYNMEPAYKTRVANLILATLKLR